MKWFIISQNSGIQGTTSTWTDLESLDSHSTIRDYIVFVDESGDANFDPIDPRFPMLNLVFSLVRKDYYIDFVVPQLHQLKIDFFSHGDPLIGLETPGSIHLQILHMHHDSRSNGSF
jgi:hypothetical protein